MDHPALLDDETNVRWSRQEDPAKLLCPFGCRGEGKVNNHGYCKHLVGWTLDGKVVELREPLGEEFERTGREKRELEPDDIVVPRKTPTSRVYRAVEPGEKPISTRSKVSQHDADIALILEELQALRDENKELRALIEANQGD